MRLLSEGIILQGLYCHFYYSREAFIAMGIHKGVALIRGWCLFAAQHLLEEIGYVNFLNVFLWFLLKTVLKRDIVNKQVSDKDIMSYFRKSTNDKFDGRAWNISV